MGLDQVYLIAYQIQMRGKKENKNISKDAHDLWTIVLSTKHFTRTLKRPVRSACLLLFFPFIPSYSIHLGLTRYDSYAMYQCFNKSDLGSYLQFCISQKYDIGFHGLILFYDTFLGCCSNAVAMDYTMGVSGVSKDQSPAILHSKAIVPEKCDLLQYLRPGQ